MTAKKPDERDDPRRDDPAGSGDVMSSLPRTRPQRPSRRRTPAAAGGGVPKRAARPRAKPAAQKGKQESAARRKPAGVRASAATNAARKPPPLHRPPSPPSGTDLVGTAVAAAGELAQLGLSLGTRALRDAAKRIPRP